MGQGDNAMTKREFLKVLGMGAGVVIAPPVRAAAQRRILGADTAGDFPVPGGSPEFWRFLAGVRAGDARAHGALTVFWLRGRAQAPLLQISTLEEARARGGLLITERQQPTVTDLIVDNRGKTHVLLLAGEILVGGKQNRIVTEDILLPPLSGPVNIGVYCVEQGRWAGRNTEFSAKGGFAASGLRSRVMQRADQQQVWGEVKRYSGRVGAASPTESYQAIYDKAEVKKHQQDVERTLDHRAAPGALGAAVFVGEKLAGLDLFEDAGLFVRQWPKLLRAHAIETYGLPAADGGREPRLKARVQDLLGKAATVDGTLRRNAGAGRLFEFRVDVARGSALMAEGQVVHAAIL